MDQKLNEYVWFSVYTRNSCFHDQKWNLRVHWKMDKKLQTRNRKFRKKVKYFFDQVSTEKFRFEFRSIRLGEKFRGGAYTSIIEWCLIMDKQMRPLIEQGRLLNRSRWQRCVKQVIDYKSKRHLSSGGTYGAYSTCLGGLNIHRTVKFSLLRCNSFLRFQRIAVARAFTPGCMRW